MIELLYEDVCLVVCVKPIGVCSQSTPQKDGLPDLLCTQLQCPVFCVHRLDTATGGVMVYAKTQKMATTLCQLFATGAVKKEYLAVLSRVPAQDTAELRDYLYHDKIRNKTYVVDRERKGVKEALLSYTTLQTEVQKQFSLVHVTLKTGRTHQIRAQFAARKCPLYADGKYGAHQNGTLGLWSAAVTLNLHGEERRFYCLPPAVAPWTFFERKEESL